MTLLWPVGMILPVAEATMSTWPKNAHASARQKRAMMLNTIVRPTGDGGVSTISSAAGRNASSCLSRPLLVREEGSTFRTFGVAPCDVCLADCMDARLEAMERRVAPLRIDELVVGTVLRQPAAIDGDDAVSPAHRGEAIGNNEDRPTLGDLPHVVLDNPLALVIERAGRLVEDHDARIGDESPGDGNALALATREAAAALAHDSVVALRQFQDEIVRARKCRRGDDTFDRNARVGQRDVVPHRTVEQDIFLQHYADLSAQPGRIYHGEIGAVDQDASTLRHVQTLDELGESTLARTRRTDNANDLAGIDLERNIVQYLGTI